MPSPSEKKIIFVVPFLFHPVGGILSLEGRPEPWFRRLRSVAPVILRGKVLVVEDGTGDSHLHLGLRSGPHRGLAGSFPYVLHSFRKRAACLYDDDRRHALSFFIKKLKRIAGLWDDEDPRRGPRSVCL